ncbi:MAG: helix-turn-helix domain-containing protein [Actinomycetes bacterium]
MIESDKRKAVYLLHEQGMSIRELARKLCLSRQSVRSIIGDRGNFPKIERVSTLTIAPELIGRLYIDCHGFIQRMHEKLAEEEGIQVGYSTLTRQIRAMGLGVDPAKDKRDARVPDEPGQEMQHDTSPYELDIGGKKFRVAGSSLYLRYSKVRYLKFYPSFTRFRMKCFFNEALTHFGYTAGTCVIDNTNLAVLRGSGKNAVMVPEMTAFAKSHGDFKWLAHEINHSDRKGGVERGFWFVETNFFPGRKFESLEDLNAQALEWATKRIVLKPHAKSKLIPAQLFEFEKAYLKKIPPFVPAPVLLHERQTDQYGYAAFDGNYYWIPGIGRGVVQVLQYSEKVRIHRNRDMLVEYGLPPDGVKRERFRPPGIPAIKKEPHKRPIEGEEKRLRAIDPIVAAYLEFLAKAPESRTKRHRLIRELHSLSLKLAASLFIQTIARAERYRITDGQTIERIAVQLMRDNSFQMELWSEPGEETNNSDVYREGELTPIPDMSKYDEEVDQNTEGGSNDEKEEE